MASNYYYGYSSLPQSYASLPAGTTYLQPTVQTAYAQQQVPTVQYAIAAPSAQTVVPQYESYTLSNATATPYATAPAAAAMQYASPQAPTVQYASPQPTAVQYGSTSYAPATAYYSPVAPATQQVVYAVDPSYGQQVYQTQTSAPVPAAAVFEPARQAAQPQHYYTPATVYATVNQQPQPSFIPATTSYYSGTYVATTSHRQQQQQPQPVHQVHVQTSHHSRPYVTPTTQTRLSAPPTSSQQHSSRPSTSQWTSKENTASRPRDPPKQRSTVVAAPTASTWKRSSTSESSRHKPASSSPSFQLHYCHVCKTTCAGQKSYLEHLDTTRHKTLEAQTRSTAAASSVTTTTTVTTPSRAPSATSSRLYCEVCRVICTNADTYALHVRSTIHQKMLTAGKAESKAAPAKTVTTARPSNGKLGSAQSGSDSKPPGGDSKTKANAVDTKTATDLESTVSPDIPAVGMEYVDEFCTGLNRTVTFSCKLCECKFSDTMGKVMHCKGRKHRVMYKKKVDPNFVLDVKPATSQHRELETMIRQEARNEAFVKRLMDEKWRLECEQRHFEDSHIIPPLLPPMQPLVTPLMRAPDSYNDQHVNAKHSAIYPTENELESIQVIVSTCEKCLKLISDVLAASDGNSKGDGDGKAAVTESQRLIRGVMRVGLVSKGLLLRGDRNVELVVLCVNAPTKTLLFQVMDEFPKQLETFTKDSYCVESCVERSCFTVTRTAEDKLKVVCTITLTSPILREEALGVKRSGPDSVNTEPDDALDCNCCLLALAELRHAKWFQARANGLQSCVLVLRILRDLRQRLSAWTPLSDWSLELLAEKCLSSEGGIGLSPGNALRRIFECISAGILLPGGLGLLDPCEKDPVDSAQDLTVQQREDITLSAQTCLRKIAFRQISKILGMDELSSWALSSSAASQVRNKRSLSAPDTGFQSKRLAF